MNAKRILELPLTNGNVAFIDVEAIIVISKHTDKSTIIFFQGNTQVTVSMPVEELVSKLKTLGVVTTV